MRKEQIIVLEEKRERWIKRGESHGKTNLQRMQALIALG
jgi:hypothetical protein